MRKSLLSPSLFLAIMLQTNLVCAQFDIPGQPSTDPTSTDNSTETNTGPGTSIYAAGYNDWASTYPVCGGSYQSPIDIVSAKDVCDSSMVFNLMLSENVTFTLNITSTVLRGIGALGQLYASDLNGNLFGYYATHWNLHAPSEHKIEGEGFDAELQIYFDLLSSFTPIENRTKAVVSILLSTFSNSTSNGSSVLAPFGLGANSTNTTLNFSRVIQEAIPLTDAGTVLYYTYQGSLTTPPCSEIVNWYVIAEALPISWTDLDYLNSLWASNTTFADGLGNNRTTQNLNGRSIKQGGSACEQQLGYFIGFFFLFLIINYFLVKVL
mmetsp:Transcript_28585/g.33036  ORF Transcript_28585/g.33036 Transcript_28585/m.33036 type:complete len:323 (+) Transcript_28585:35-1003(+)